MNELEKMLAVAGAQIPKFTVTLHVCIVANTAADPDSLALVAAQLPKLKSATLSVDASINFDELAILAAEKVGGPVRLLTYMLQPTEHGPHKCIYVEPKPKEMLVHYQGRDAGFNVYAQRVFAPAEEPAKIRLVVKTVRQLSCSLRPNILSLGS